MKDKFKVRVYRDSNLRKDDFAFTWEGELEYDLVNGLDPKTGKPVYDELFIRVIDWTNFVQAFHEAKINKYYPVAFWRHYSEDGMFEIGQTDIVKVNCDATHVIH